MVCHWKNLTYLNASEIMNMSLYHLINNHLSFRYENGYRDFILRRPLVIFDNHKYMVPYSFVLYLSLAYFSDTNMCNSLWSDVKELPRKYSENFVYSFSLVPLPEIHGSLPIIYIFITVSIALFSFKFLKKVIQNITFSNLYFFIPSLVIILFFTILSFNYPTFSFRLMVIMTCIINTINVTL